MRIVALVLAFLASEGSARRTYRVSGGSEDIVAEERADPAFQVGHGAEAETGDRPANVLASLLFAANPVNAVGPQAYSAVGRPSLTRPRDHTRRSRLQQSILMDRGEDSESTVLDNLSSQAMSSAMAMALALAPAIASAAPPDLYKVDKTGIIGGVANVIEGGIDLAHNGLVSAGIGGAYGISILLFTLLIKIITVPLLQTQLQTTMKMQQIQPLQKKIMETYGPREEQEKNQMLAQLFQTADVNPLASLLPAFVQIPIFISLYRALQNLIAADKLEESFLWIPSLEGPVSGSGGLDWITSAFSGNPTWGYEGTLQFLSLSLILYIVQTASIKISQAPRPDPDAPLNEQERMSQQITTFIPLLITFFSFNVPAGLSIYWIFNSICTTIFTQVIKQQYKDIELPPQVQRIVEAVDRKAESSQPKFVATPGGGNYNSNSNVNVKVKTPAMQATTDAVSFDQPIEAESVRVEKGTKKKKKRPKKSKKR